MDTQEMQNSLNNEEVRYCPKCGEVLDKMHVFCPKCGTQVNANGRKKGKTHVLIIGIPALVMVAAIVLLFVLRDGSATNKKGPDFKALYEAHCEMAWAEVGEDGSYLRIDTNPYDEEDNGLAYVGAYRAIQAVNGELKLPDYILTDMGNTTGADGKQSEAFAELGVTVSWSYHPDKGLEVTYKRN